MTKHSLRSSLPVPFTFLGRALTVAILFLALGGIVAARNAVNEVPFKGSVEGFSIITPIDATSFGVLFFSTGHATQLGQFTGVAPHVVDTTNGTAIGSLVLTASNGDTVTADFTGASFPTANPVVFSIVETAIISGGTGRFAAATGSFTIERLVDLATGLTSGSFEGTISK